MRKSKDETVAHIASECSILAWTEYKARHDKVAGAVYLSILKAYGLPHPKSWYKHQAVKVRS